MPYLRGLKCRECARTYPAEALHVCEWCLGPLEVDYDYDAIASVVTRERIAQGPLTIWRYADLLPAMDAYKAEGLSLREIAAKLNADGHTTRRGKPWNQVQVSRVLERATANAEK